MSKGFDAWVEVFKGGPQTDSSGKTMDGDTIIEKALATFDPKTHEPPVVVGHPKTDAPAFGWVAALRKAVRNGVAVLEARFKDVVPEFAALVKAGMYKKRSIAIDRDGRLRHVGFLGAAAPAVKGLADLKFGDAGEITTFESAADAAAGTEKEKPMKVKEFMEALKFWKAFQADPDTDLSDLLPDRPGKPAGTFTEAEVSARVAEAEKAAAEKAKKEAAAEFAEQQQAAVRAAAKKTISDWCEKMVEDGRITPALVKTGLPTFMEGLDLTPATFAEGDGEKTPLAFFMEFMEGLGPVVPLGEAAGRDEEIPSVGKAGAKLEALTARKMEKKPDLTYGAAFSEVQREHPDLAKEYAAEIEIS